MPIQDTYLIEQSSTLRFFSNKRLIVPFILFLTLLFEPVRHLTITTLADAFFQVSVFVAATLLLYYFVVEKIPQLQLSYLNTKSSLLEVFFAACLGALPGCGGAIIVVTQFTKKQASFASVVAVLTATMGDAAFLLLATRPLEGFAIIGIGILVGTLSGYFVSKCHKASYCQPLNLLTKKNMDTSNYKTIKASSYVWKIMLVPSLIIALLIAFNIDLGEFDQLISICGAAMALFAVIMWSLSSEGKTYKQVTAEDDECSPPSKLFRVLQDTHFVTTWVVASFMLYELSVVMLGLDLKQWFSEYAVYAPLIAIFIGFLPGCGPQIVVTTLYIQGIIPFSALVGNAISNDGDALFPAIAMAPKAAMIATFYSAIPAIIVSYVIYFFF